MKSPVDVMCCQLICSGQDRCVYLLSVQRRAPEWEHLGVLGPMLRGVVGDTLLVTFMNKLSNNSVSIHSHGMLYDKESEGSPYSDGLPCE